MSISVTGFIHFFVNEFDADAVIARWWQHWQDKKHMMYFGRTPEEIKQIWKNNNAAELGTLMHRDIEYTWKGISLPEENTSVEFKHFINYREFYVKPKGWLPYRVEGRIFHEELDLAGSVDMVYKCPDGSIAVHDWKRSKEIKYEGFENQRMKYPLEHLPDANYHHYCLQLNLYRRILEEKYNERVSAMAMVIFFPANVTYVVIQVPWMDKEIDDMFAIRKMMIAPPIPPEIELNKDARGPLGILIQTCDVPAVCRVGDPYKLYDSFHQELSGTPTGGYEKIPPLLKETIVKYHALTGLLVMKPTQRVHRDHSVFFGCIASAEVHNPVGLIGLLDYHCSATIELTNRIPLQDLIRTQYMMFVTGLTFVDYIAINTERPDNMTYLRTHPSEVFVKWMEPCLFYFSGCLSDTFNEDGTLAHKPPSPEFYAKLAPAPVWSVTTRDMFAELYS